VEDLANQVSREFFRKHLRLLDPDRHVRVHCLVRPGSEDLVGLFLRGQRGAGVLANDSSIGVGYAPLSAVERGVLAVDHALRGAEVRSRHPAFGEDTKVLALRRGGQVELTVACAFCDRHVADLAQYQARKADLAAIAAQAAGDAASVAVNAADDPAAGSIYLTVTGTSAEAGDDGEAGRGNRANGLITPGRPMSMEGVAGKNPVSHVGKLYNLAARRIAEDVVAGVAGVMAAECFLVSRIGHPITEPQLTHVRLATHDGRPVGDLQPAIDAIVHEQLGKLDAPLASLAEGIGAML
jgi:S-adenosylmethionine synthetase